MIPYSLCLYWELYTKGGYIARWANQNVARVLTVTCPFLDQQTPKDCQIFTLAPIPSSTPECLYVTTIMHFLALHSVFFIFLCNSVMHIMLPLILQNLDPKQTMGLGVKGLVD